MTIPKWIRLRRISGLGGLLVVAVMAAVMMVGPASAHHGKGGHAGGDKGTNETAKFTFVVSGDLAGNVTTTQALGRESGIHIKPQVGEVLKLNMAGFLYKNVGRPDLTGWGKCFAGGTFAVEGGG